MSYSQKHPNPRVIVVGAGIGGLMMGLLLGKAGITYQIFERSSNVKALGKRRKKLFFSLFHTTDFFTSLYLTNSRPMATCLSLSLLLPMIVSSPMMTYKKQGALMSINANILPVFEQLGLLAEVQNISLRNHGSSLFNSKMKEIGKVGIPNYQEL